MKRISLYFLLLLIFCLSGCGTIYQYKGNTLPSLSSPIFPSFSPVSEIFDGTKFKLALGKGKYKVSMEMLVYSPSKSGSIGQAKLFPAKAQISMNANLDWDLSYKNYQFINKNEFKIIGFSSSTSSALPADLKKIEKSKIKIQSTYDSKGKAVKVEGWIDDEQIDFNDEKFKEFKDFNSSENSVFYNWGKIVKTGDVLRNMSPKEIPGMENIFNKKAQVKMSEIIKGWGVYENKKVIVSEYILDDNFRNPDNNELILEVRGKFYNLYDAETFIPLYGKGTGYLNVFNPKEGTMLGEIKFEMSAYDIQVNEIIDAPISGKIGSTEKSPVKPDWSEAKDKMNALGELLEKNLITQEEYNDKKRKLLEQF